MITARPHISSMAAYVLADLAAPEGVEPVSMAQNESLRLPSPAALEAGARALASAHLYPDPDWMLLRDALASAHRVAPGSILCGAGSMVLIACLTQAYAGPQRAVLASQYGYAFFRTAATSVQARCDLAGEVDYSVSIDAHLAAVREDTRLVFVANPANPTGTRIPRSEVVRLREQLPADTLLVVDEAYSEFADGIDSPMFDLVQRGDTVVLRTLSKAYGLASARVGWGLFPRKIALEVRKLLNPNNISAVSQAMASAAVEDQLYMQETVAKTAHRREQLREVFLQAGFAVPRSFTNFLLVDFGDTDTAKQAEAGFRRQGLLMRALGGYELAHCLRATVTDYEDMAVIRQTLANLPRSGGTP